MAGQCNAGVTSALCTFESSWLSLMALRICGNGALQVAAGLESSHQSSSSSSLASNGGCHQRQWKPSLQTRFLGPLPKHACRGRFPEVRGRFLVTAEAVAVSRSSDVQKEAGIDWDNMGFGLRATDYMFTMTCQLGGEWSKGEVKPFGDLSLSPSAAVLNYGQGVFEGLKAQRTAEGKVLLFRPSENAKRMTYGAARMSMPPPPENVFVDAVMRTVAANERWVPPHGKGSLYIRPLLIGTGAVLGLAPAPEYTFLIYVSPVGSYFKGGQLTPLDLKVEEHFHRAAPGGTGGVKTITNYAPVLGTQLEAKRNQFADVMYLDAVENKYLEEVSSCNVFVLKGQEIATPDLRGTILPGITRKSIIELARSEGFEVNERPVAVEELLTADEVFCTGTAVVVSPVGSITYKGQRLWK